MELNRVIIEAAIAGFERQKEQIDETIAELRAQLDGASSKTDRKPNAGGPTKTKRQMSPAARKRMAAAQKARWAAFHAKEHSPAKKSASTAPSKAPTRKMSPATKAKLAANLAKARAAKAKKAAMV
jgi:hypothetical protein